MNYKVLYIAVFFMRKISFLLLLTLFITSAASAQLKPMFDYGKKADKVVVEVDEGKKVDVSLELMNGSLVPGEPSLLAVVLAVNGDGHLYANPNSDGIGLPTVVSLAPVNGLEVGQIQYPEGESYTDAASGSTDMIYEGQIVIIVPVKLSEGFSGDNISFEISLKGLYCTNSQCLPWSDSVDLLVNTSSVDDALVVDSVSDIFSGLNPGSYFDVAGKSVSLSDQAQTVENSGVALVLVNIFFAMLAGLIMNIMPCVLPVIPLKVLSIIKQGQQAKASGDNFKALKLSLAFAAGIIILFAALGLVLSGFNMAYGQQFQSFTFKLTMFLLVFVMALSMFGLFEIILPSSLASLGVVKDGYAGSFMMGIMATLLATPCSAPFLGGILYWALEQSAAMTLVIFISIGFGMSFPYVLLTAFPKFVDRIPAAGNWMVRLKEGLAFVMLAVAAYMVSWFSQDQIPALLFLAVAVAFGLWLSFQVVNFMSPPAKKYSARIIAILLVLVVGFSGFAGSEGGSKVVSDSFSDIIRMRTEALAEGRPVYMEFTAQWCPNCKYVEHTVIKNEAFQNKLTEKNALLLIVDWTDNSDEIKQELNRLGSKSIPFTAVFHPGKEDRPILLRDIYSLQSALDALDSVK